MRTSPFPGMDPFLEMNPHWDGFHNWFIRKLCELHRPVAQDMNVWIDVERTIYQTDPSGEVLMMLGSPDVLAGLDPEFYPAYDREHSPPGGVALAAPKAIHEVVLDPKALHQHRQEYVVVRTRDDERRVLAVVELLSFANKRGSYMAKYREKRVKLLTGYCHFMEIDFLRAGSNPSREMFPELEPSPYFIFVARKTGAGRMEEGYPLQLQDELPVIGLPISLASGDLPLDLAAVFRSAYDLSDPPGGIKYNWDQLPPPDLSPADAEWARQLLTTAK